MRRDQRRQSIGDRVRIEHMRLAADAVRRFVDGRSREDVGTDEMLRRALVNAIQDIGEAAANVSDAGRARAANVPWGKIVQMRHFLVHVYWGIDLDRLWDTASLDIPALLAEIDEVCRTWPAADPRA
jgi:uncharacterized protein with HEPN domain